MSNSSPVLLDTWAAIWLMAQEPFSEEGRDAVRLAREGGSGVYVSPFTAWEIAIMVAKGRIQLTQPPELWFATLLALPGVRLAPLTPAILIGSAVLPGSLHNDPADRIIVATARTYGYCLVTRDQSLLDYAKAGYMRAIAC